MKSSTYWTSEGLLNGSAGGDGVRTESSTGAGLRGFCVSFPPSNPPQEFSLFGVLTRRMNHPPRSIGASRLAQQREPGFKGAEVLRYGAALEHEPDSRAAGQVVALAGCAALKLCVDRGRVCRAGGRGQRWGGRFVHRGDPDVKNPARWPGCWNRCRLSQLRRTGAVPRPACLKQAGMTAMGV